MKRPFILVLTVFVARMTVLTPVSSLGKHLPAESERWDIQMVKGARIWRNLLTNYYYAEHEKYWPERKAALKKIVEQFPDSQWADDAALILACDKASFENDPNGAITDLKNVVEQYPEGQTIVSHWHPQDGCRLDETWITWQGGIAFLNRDGTLRIAKPLDRDGEICQMEREALAYFGHLKRYPRATKVMAQLFISQILAQEGDTAGAIAALEKIVSSAGSYIAVISEGDRIAASQLNGYYMRTLAMRPEYQAYLLLIGHREKREEVDKAVQIADNFLNLCSKDGWLWTINKHIGDFYNRHGLRERAKEQYQLSMKGLMVYREDMEKRSKLVEGSDIPDNFWENESRELKERLREKPR